MPSYDIQFQSLIQMIVLLIIFDIENKRKATWLYIFWENWNWERRDGTKARR